MHILLTQIEYDTGETIGKALVSVNTTSFVEDKEDKVVSVYSCSDMFFYCKESLEDILKLIGNYSCIVGEN